MSNRSYLWESAKNFNNFFHAVQRAPLHHRRYNFKSGQYEPAPAVLSKTPMRRYGRRRAFARPRRRAYRRYGTRKRRYGRSTNLRRFKLRARRRVGNYIGADARQSHVLDPGAASLPVRDVMFIATRTLYGMLCTDIAKMTSTFNRTARFFQKVNFRGVAVHMVLRNTHTLPVVFNYAVVSSKNQKYSISAGTTAPSTVPGMANSGFFRFYGNSRDTNFSNSLSSIEFNYSPIDTDKFNVHMHRRTLLNATTNDGSTGYRNESGSNFKQIRTYVPIKRQLRYNDDSDDLCETPIFLVYWCDIYQANTNNIPANSIVGIQNYSRCFFSQSKCC